MKERLLVTKNGDNLLRNTSEAFDVFNHYRSEFKKAANEHNLLSAAHAAIKLVDENVNKSINDITEKIICKKGCSYCCYQNVSTSIGEALLLIHHCKDRKIKINWKQVREQNKDWDKLSFKDMKCPFLAGDECSVYEARPLVCRMYLSVDGTAEKCNTEIPNKVRLLASNIADIITMALWNCEGEKKLYNIQSALLKAKSIYKKG